MTGTSTPSSGLSPRSARFRHSVHHIPTPGVDADRPKRYDPLITNLWIVGSIAVLMIVLGVGLEIALHLSSINNGFYVPQQNIFSFVSTQFLTSFFPTLLVAPLGFFWSVADWMLRWYQPYVTLSEGNASADKSILLDYTLAHKYLCAHCAIGDIPTATRWFGAPGDTDATALSLRTVGLLPTISQLNAFLASAGFADAAVYNNLEDPPFIRGGWAAAQFSVSLFLLTSTPSNGRLSQAPPQSLLNGSLAINTTGIQTKVNCVNAASLTLAPLTAGNFSISSTSPTGCASTVIFNSSDASQQYGVMNTANCAAAGQDIAFQPVMFWFFHLNTSNEPEAAAVFCRPTIGVFNIEAAMNLNDGSLGNVTVFSSYVPSNNVTGSPLNGQAYNGVTFDPSSDPFIQARATAIGSGIPGTIFRYATQLPNGPQSTFGAPNGFVNATTTVYTQHLALAAKSIYFLPVNQTLPAQLTSSLPRLFIEPLSAHLLSALLIIIGVIGMAVQAIHRHSRRHLRLTSPPGSIAAIVSLTSRSGFGELLLPYDNEESMSAKLAGLTFRLDRRTGAILAEEDGFVNPDGSMMTLLDGKHKRGYSCVGVDSLRGVAGIRNIGTGAIGPGFTRANVIGVDVVGVSVRIIGLEFSFQGRHRGCSGGNSISGELSSNNTLFIDGITLRHRFPYLEKKANAGNWP
ncbi:hypothetical protein BV22DRAFT_1113507 [Leucogyrophana mollusca]|uniref:Uncharacterized protein n=1 Tax=Leucogyrophana mollusca TaxID=85980 RepID=A0ACB8BCR5_9AGAM|nr:hypothetical protein BV22DRAFT_1113507 [Leucogyrophana mollusca]